MWWTVTLLSIAVVLPTICLLWFMTQAVRNERLAVKQKLTNAYEQRLEILSGGMDDLWSRRISSVRQRAESELEPIEMFAHLASQDNASQGQSICDAVVIYDNAGRAVYPVTGEAENRDEFPDEFNKAWGAEFTEKDFTRAIRLYEQIAESHYDDYVRYSALMGEVRCLRKSSQTQKALALCREVAYGQTPENIS